MDKTQIGVNQLKKYPYRINWEITRKCNFTCPYCINDEQSKYIKEPHLSQENIINVFDKTGISWLILITGGEPFMSPGFVDLCEGLQKKHHLQITTNLSSPGVYDFANRINPDKVFVISASFHVIEREKRNMVKDFTDKCQYLQDKGFKVLANYLAYPPLLNRMEDDLIFLNKHGIGTFVLTFRGKYNGKIYPEAYNSNNIDTIIKHTIEPDIEYHVSHKTLNYYGQYCEAGSKYFHINTNGDISRCATLTKKTGNIFSDPIPVDNSPAPCIANNCRDAYIGAAAVKKQKANNIKCLLEKRKYRKLP
ncbi:MAG: radical SAM protein [Bacteroidales bacterium]